jgi:hypothetical protein
MAFHNLIRLDEENQILREKRDQLLERLQRGLRRDFMAKGKVPPSFSTLNQGSYAMNTGITPADGEFDIDVGVVFEISRRDFPDPVVVKAWVRDALAGPNTKITIRNSCVTVSYVKNGNPYYHVDIAVFCPSSNGEQMYIGKGRENSLEKSRNWEPADPKGLIKLINGHRKGDEAAQFRRVIRYLKSWRDETFKKTGNAAPVGIGLTVAAYHWFQPQTRTVEKTQQFDDLATLRALVKQMLDRFSDGFLGLWEYRLRVALPVAPKTDVFARMSLKQMKDLETELKTLLASLSRAGAEVDPVAACEILRTVFGQRFPIPKPSTTGKRLAAPSVMPTSYS